MSILFIRFFKFFIMYEIFADLLTKKGVKATNLAKELGIPPSTFSDWKSGKCKPKYEKLEKIADYFGVSVEYLRTGKESKSPVPTFEPEMVDLITYYSKLSDENKKMIMDLIKKLGGSSP